MDNSNQLVFGISNFYDWLSEFGHSFSSFFIIADENTARYCLPLFNVPEPRKWQVIEIGVGEDIKNIETCTRVWEILMNKGADRKSLLVNIGGGLVTDLGAFVAASYKRGIAFVNIPTSLLGMVDAAIGNKTGVNFMEAKNQIGSFSMAEKIVIEPNFLSSLPKSEFISGMGEIVKYGLIWDKSILQKLHFSAKKTDIKLIEKCIAIKNEIVSKDPLENGLRKILNFGHTIGHSLESYSHRTGQPLHHGIAVAWGMLAESYLSFKKLNFKELETVQSLILKKFPKPKFKLNTEAIEQIIAFTLHDKKNENGLVKCVLLKKIGKAETTYSVNNEDLKDALIWLKSVI